LQRANPCHRLGDSLRTGAGVDRDAPRAALLYEKACNARFAPSCAALGRMYEHGDGVAKQGA
jgi:uncharacterized protein